jgi:hypothetical protein
VRVTTNHKAMRGRNRAGSSPSRSQAATLAHVRLGSATDREVMRMVDSRPGISVYEAARSLGFTAGKVDGSVARLQRRKKLDVGYVLRDGRLAKELYPKGLVSESQDTISFDLGILESPEDWKETAYLYALDRMTMGVSPVKNEDWRTRALTQEPVGIRREDRRFIMEVPPKLLDFYVWENSSYEASALGNLVLITLRTKMPISVRGEMRTTFRLGAGLGVKEIEESIERGRPN